MVDTNAINGRIHLLSNQYWVKKDIENYLGIEKISEKFMEKYSKWYKLKYMDKIEDIETLNVWRIEDYLNKINVISLKGEAIKNGMSKDSFKMFMDKICTEFLDLEELYFCDEFIYKEKVEEIIRELMKNQLTYKDHNERCQKFHDILETKGINVQGVYCETSKLLSENPIIFANTFDDFTGEPVSIKYTLVFDLKKPITLSNYVCSYKTYSQYEDILKGSVIEDIDEKLLATLRNIK